MAFILYSIYKKSSRVKRAEIALNPDTKSNKQGFWRRFYWEMEMCNYASRKLARSNSANRQILHTVNQIKYILRWSGYSLATIL